ncbi:hypothetical protein GCM10022249_02010 [Enteractinococcus coprophilus]
MADPGLAEDIAQRVSEDLAMRLRNETDEEWEVENVQEELPLGPDGNVALGDFAPKILERHGWDYVFYLTDLPAFHDKQPILCRTVAHSRGALIVLPALGAIRLPTQVLELVLTLLSTLSGTTEGIDPQAVGRDIQRQGMVQLLPGNSQLVLLRGPLSRCRMLAGMLRGNRPFRLPGAMSGFITAGAASGAFGVFYSSIWDLADAHHPIRLLLIGILSVALLTMWLIYRNGLWTSRKAPETPLDNIATVITVGVGVLVTYLILCIGLFALAIVIVDANYLASQLEHTAGLESYFRLSWLAASLGTLAGALGANFDSDDAIRQATYSRRWHERRKMFDTYKESTEEERSED